MIASGLTASIARFAIGTTHDATPVSARELALIAIADGIGVMVAGARSPVGQAIRRYAEQQGGSAEASLVPGSKRLPAELAALANGTSGHALDFDDTTHPAHAHPTAVLFAAALAAAQVAGVTGRDLITAYLVGFEFEGALGRGMNLSHYRAGWHATSSFGSLAAAVVASRLLGLDPERTASAIGIAASSAGGLRANFGTMTKPLHAGLAAETGVRAARLAASGWTASGSILEADHGFASTLAGDGRPDLAAIGDGLGSRWTILEPYGLALKRYPSCGATHPALDATFALRGETGDRPIRAVRIGTSRLSAAVLSGSDPRTTEAARFSLEYVIATALVQGSVGPADFDPERLGDPIVRAMMARISTAVHRRVEDSTEYAAVVTFEFEDGSTIERQVDVARGKNSAPLSSADRLDKFRSCVGDGADELWAAIARLDDDPAAFASIQSLLATMPAA